MGTFTHEGTATLAPATPGRTLKVARTAHECLDMAADRIEKHGFICHHWGHRKGPSCTVAAIHSAAGLTVTDTDAVIVGTVEDFDTAGYGVPGVVEWGGDGEGLAVAYASRMNAEGNKLVTAEHARRQAVAYAAIGRFTDWLIGHGRLVVAPEILDGAGPHTRRQLLIEWSDQLGDVPEHVVSALREAAKAAAGDLVTG